MNTTQNAIVTATTTYQTACEASDTGAKGELQARIVTSLSAKTALSTHVAFFTDWYY